MKFFIASSLCWGYHPKDVIKIAKKYNFSGVEMWAEHIYFHDADPEEIRKYSEQECIPLTLHASSWDLNICSINQGVQHQSIKELKSSIDLAAQLNALHMTFHPGRYTVKSNLTDYHQEKLLGATEELLNYARRKHVTLSMELMEPIPKEMLTNPVQMNTFQEMLREDLHVTLDIAHVPLNNDPIKYYEQLKHVNSIHLSDSSKEQYHVPLGEGEIDIQQTLHFFKKTNLPIVLEGMDTTRDLSFLNKHVQFLSNNGWLERKENV